MTPLWRCVAVLALTAPQFCVAWPGRSAAAVAEFKRENPCPATGKPRGACPGWQIDHITPLCAGGADLASNMAWAAVKDHKVKTKLDQAMCRRLKQATKPVELDSRE